MKIFKKLLLIMSAIAMCIPCLEFNVHAEEITLSGDSHNLIIRNKINTLNSVDMPIDNIDFDIELIVPKEEQLNSEYEVTIQYSMWHEETEKKSLNDGHMIVTLPDNGNAIIKELPEGTQYKVIAKTPEGYVSKWDNNINSGFLTGDVTLDCTNQTETISFSLYKSLGRVNYYPGSPVRLPEGSSQPVVSIASTYPLAIPQDNDEISQVQLVLYEYNEDTGEIGRKLTQGTFIEKFNRTNIADNAGRFDFTWKDSEFKGGTYAIKEPVVPMGILPLSDDDFWIVTLNDYAQIQNVKCSNNNSNFSYMSSGGYDFLINVSPATIIINIQKEVVAKSIDADKEFTFTVDLKPLKGMSLPSSYQAVIVNTNLDYSSPDYAREENLPVVNEQITFKLKHNEMIMLLLTEYLEYTVNELETDGYTTTWSKLVGINEKIELEAPSGTLTAEDFNSLFICTNTLGYGNLTVNKTVTGSAGDKEKDFTFTVTLDDSSINDTYGNMKFENGIAKFTLKHNESITATDLPAGIKYKVEESNNEGYTVTAENDEGSIIGNKEVLVKFINNKIYQGGLRVTNHVTGQGDKNKDFTYTITLDDRSINGTYGDITFKDGVAEFTLKDGESKTATELPENLNYVVTETDNEGYTVTMEGETGNVIANNIVDIVFINHLEIKSDNQESNNPDTPKTPETPDNSKKPHSEVSATVDKPEIAETSTHETPIQEDVTNIVKTSDDFNGIYYGFSMMTALIGAFYILKRKHKLIK